MWVGLTFVHAVLQHPPGSAGVMWVGLTFVHAVLRHPPPGARAS